MTRRLTLVFAPIALCLAVAPALAQSPSFRREGGPLGPAVPGVLDINNNGPDAGDVLAWFFWQNRTAGEIGVQSSQGPLGLLFGYSSGDYGPDDFIDGYARSPTGRSEIIFDQITGNQPTGGRLNMRLYEAGFELLDMDRNGIYETASITNAGSPTALVPDTLLTLMTVNTGGDDLPDYVSVGGLTSLLSSCVGCPPNDIWLPLAPSGPTTKSVILDLDGDGNLDSPEFLVGPPLAGTARASIPTLGQWGLLALVLAMVAIGLRTLRIA